MRSSLYFIKLLFLSLLSSVIFACGDDEHSSGKEAGLIDVQPGMNVVGRVTDGSNPIEGVVVSDGYSVVTTDADGVYQIGANSKAEFVYISIPADCEIPVDENNCPMHYQTIDMQTNEVQYKNFTLKKAAIQKNFRLLALADVQISIGAQVKCLEEDIPVIAEYIKSLNDQPIYGISLGDLSWDNMAIYPTYKQNISKLNMPIFSVIGNHDHNNKVNNRDDLADAEFKEAFGPTYYSYNIGDCHFVVLDDVYYKGPSNDGYETTITTEQFNWLKKDLSYVSKDKLIILGVHIPIKRRNSTAHLTNIDELYDILEGYHVRILSGHSHDNYTTTHTAMIEEQTLGAICGSLWYKNNVRLCNDGSPSGYAIYEIVGNEIKNWYYKGIYTPKEEQMRLYKPGDDKSGKYPNDALVNIFTWHTNWKSVELFEDGVLKQTLTDNIKVIDPLAYTMLGGAQGRIKALNDHMFKYTPSINWNEIEVRAEDAYGNKYEKKIINE